MRVGYQGEPGAYSDEAVAVYLGEGDITPVPCDTFADVFDQLRDGRIDVAVLPVENSYAGDVGEVYDLLRRVPCWIGDELALPVRHCLMAPAGSDLSRLRTVRSHPQALSQCREFLRRHGLVAQPVHDTAAAARQVAAEGRIDLGAIASLRAARHHRLQVLAEDIQDAPDNTTRFLVISGRRGPFPVDRDREVPLRRPAAKTYLLFAVADRPGALSRCLQALADNEINMTKLTSRPFPGRPWYYMFFADLDGSIEQPLVRAALESMRDHAVYLRVLGSFPSQVPAGPLPFETAPDRA